MSLHSNVEPLDTSILTLSDDDEGIHARRPTARQAGLIVLLVTGLVACAAVALVPESVSQAAHLEANVNSLGFVGLAEKKGKHKSAKADKGSDEDEDEEEDEEDTEHDDGKKDKEDKKGKDKEEKEEAPPCKTEHADDSPSLFCWAVMFDDDKDLITSTFTGRAGIFACNSYAVVSTIDMKIGDDDCGVEVKTLVTDLPKVEKGQYGVNAMTSSWLNVPIFLKCWDLLIENGKVWEQDFTVKVDPDTVFFPQRLGALLQEHKGKPKYVTDCKFWEGDPEGKVFGALEVLSKEAMGAYKGNVDTCKNLGWQGWGEDYWLQHCMRAIGIDAVNLADFVTDGTCPLGGYADCGDQKWVGLHPYKDPGSWWDCWKKSNPGA